MKIVKLNQRYRLGRAGFLHALVFTTHNDPYLKKKTQVQRLLQEKYGDSVYFYGTDGKSYYDRYEKPMWATYTQTRHPSGVTHWYLGLREESMLTTILLMVE